MTAEKDEGLVGEVEAVKGEASERKPQPVGAQGDSVGLAELSCKGDYGLQRGLGFFTYTHTLLFFLYLTETRGSRD